MQVFSQHLKHVYLSMSVYLMGQNSECSALLLRALEV